MFRTKLISKIASVIMILSLLGISALTNPPKTASAAPIVHNVYSSALTWVGNWAPITFDPLALDNYRRFTQNNGDYIELTFIGTTISYVYMMAYNRAVIEVKLDNKIIDILDARSNDFQGDLMTPVYRHQVVKTYITYPGQHTIRLTLRRGDSGSGRYFMGLNAFIVDIGFSGYGTHDQTNSYASYFGSWYRWDADEAFGDWFLYSVDPGAGVRFTFEGDNIIWYYTKAYNRGEAIVTIDGGVGQYYVDLYSPVTLRNQYTMFTKLGDGIHTIEIVNLGAKNPASSGYVIDVDAFNVYYGQDGNGYNRLEAANYADSFTDVYNNYYASFSGNDCTNVSSQALRAGDIWNHPSNPALFNMNDPEQWWHDPTFPSSPYSSITWRATPNFVDYAEYRSTEFQFVGSLEALAKGDLIILDAWDEENDELGHDGIADHIRIVLDWAFTSPFHIDYENCDTNYVTSPYKTMLIDQHTIDRWHVPRTYNLQSGDIIARIHIIKN